MKNHGNNYSLCLKLNPTNFTCESLWTNKFFANKKKTIIEDRLPNVLPILC